MSYHGECDWWKPVIACSLVAFAFVCFLSTHLCHSVTWDSEILTTEAGYIQLGYKRSGIVVWRPVPEDVLKATFGGVTP